MKKSAKLSPAQSGQGFVEFVLILPILLLVVFGVIEAGRLLFIYVAVSSSSREAARYGASVGDSPGGDPRYADCTGIRAEATTLGNLIGIQNDNIVINYDAGPSTSVFDDCPVGGSGPADVELGDRIVVSVVANYVPLVPLVPLPPFPIQSVSARTILRDVPVGTAVGFAPPPTPTASPTTVPDLMWVSAMTYVLVNTTGNYWRMDVTVTISDSSGPVQAVTVAGDFSGQWTDADVTGVTNASGAVTLASSPVLNANAGTFCVDTVILAGYLYVPSLNPLSLQPPCVNQFGPTSTPTITPSPTLTPTETPTPSPTNTPTETMTPSPTLSPTVTPTNTEGPSPTPSNTSAPPTETFTPEPPTATATPDLSCAFTYGLLQISGSSVFWTIQNNTGATREIVSVTLNWPDFPGQQWRRLFFGGVEIWGGNINTPPHTINSGWSGSIADRQIPDDASRLFDFQFRDNLIAGSYDVTVTFENGCTIFQAQ